MPNVWYQDIQNWQELNPIPEAPYVKVFSVKAGCSGMMETWLFVCNFSPDAQTKQKC